MTDQPSAVSGPPPMRASNHDREQVASLLQKAMSEGRLDVAELESRLDSVYAAKTIAELEPLTKDLPAHTLSLSKGPAPATMSVNSSGDQPWTKNVVGIMSGAQRKGIWVAPTLINAVALMGGVELDFTSASLTGRETVINAVAIMGGVEIRVPDGITVIIEGVGIMGGFDGANQQCGPEAPVLRVRGVALMGGVEVKRSHRSVGS